MQKLTGIVLIVGSVSFLIAAFMPISMRFFPEADPQKRIALIENHRTEWIISDILFGAGSIIAVIGLTVFAVTVQSLADSAAIRLLAIGAAAGAAFGAVGWVVEVTNRIVLSPAVLINAPPTPGWMFPAYTILTQFALMIVGFVLLQTGLPGWLGWGMIVLAALSLVAFLIFKDMPPFTHYLLMLVMGIALLRT